MFVKSPSPLSVGARVELEFQIRNRGNRTLDPCLSSARQVLVLSDNRTGVDGRPPLGGSLSLVDHPGCERRFALEPGAHFAWKEVVEPELASFETMQMIWEGQKEIPPGSPWNKNRATKI